MLTTTAKQKNMQQYIINQLQAAISTWPGDQSHLEPSEAASVIAALEQHCVSFEQALAVYKQNFCFVELIESIFEKNDDDLLEQFYYWMLDQNPEAACAAGITAAFINQYV